MAGASAAGASAAGVSAEDRPQALEGQVAPGERTHRDGAAGRRRSVTVTGAAGRPARAGRMARRRAGPAAAAAAAEVGPTLVGQEEGRRGRLPGRAWAEPAHPGQASAHHGDRAARVDDTCRPRAMRLAGPATTYVVVMR